MTQLGINAKLVRLVKACVQHSKCTVKFNGEYEEFTVETGLKQGDSLSNRLFNTSLETVGSERDTRWFNGLKHMRRTPKTIRSLASYADDIITIGKTEEGVIWTAEKLICQGKEI
ncbi:unnamed protein product [Macrosiphum euphorbiae]|uniref:Reverse transcriptase domain-containing protein n=1 Tax=Macrosiphum euphorbiae TaxID=13131 RepID=A0AAV0X5V8_9HEMI|nr:unnamed protein product [Macrosiphum euphorbiae]